MRYVIVLFFIFCMNGSGLCQDVQNITGKVVDSETGEGVPFANIRLNGTNTGSATNSLGGFLLKLPAIHLKDSLFISSVGYHSQLVSISHILSHPVISLKPSSVILNEVTINDSDALSIVKEAVARIPENYDTSNVGMTGYFREQVKLDTFELAFSEAVVEIFKIFKTEKAPNDQIRVIKGRKKKIDYGREAQLYFWISGPANGLRGSLSEDLVKYHNAKYNPLNPQLFRFYKYEYLGSEMDEKSRTLMIGVVPRSKSKRAIVKMKLFLEESTLAFKKIEFELTQQGIDMVSRQDKGVGYAIMRNVVHASLDYDEFKYVIEYGKYKNKWYLQRVRRDWKILVNSKRRDWHNKVWKAEMDLLITDINSVDAKPITEGNIGTSESTFSTFLSTEPDNAFWEHYNIIAPEDSQKGAVVVPTKEIEQQKTRYSNRNHGFTRADTLRGMLSSLRSCYDVTFYHLDVAVDIDKKSLSGRNKIRFKAMQDFTRMQVDLFSNMNIEKVVWKNETIPFTREFNAVYINLPKPVIKSSEEEITIWFHGVPKSPDFSIPMDGGVLWDQDSLGNPWVQVVCQGSGASLWWPNKDHQSDEPDSMKIWIAVPEGFEEVSNGRLIRRTKLPDGLTRYEWEVSYPINNYNATFSIGKYSSFTDWYISDGDSLEITYHVMPYNAEKAKQLFRQVKPMLKTFEEHFGKYPFYRDGFRIVESLYPMEHQSGVCIGKISANIPEEGYYLLWHEVAHEWWGNSITTCDIADMWIHEGFATYAELIVTEALYGKEQVPQLLAQFESAVSGKEPVTGVYNVNHIHYDIGDMYHKGALIIHTLRSCINDDRKFYSLLRGIQKEFYLETVTSKEIIKYINDFLETDYSNFFRQYLEHTSIPTFEGKLEQRGSNLHMRYRWKADVPSFRLPVKVLTEKGESILHASTEWRETTIKNTTIEEFDVDQENFYIDVSIDAE